MRKLALLLLLSGCAAQNHAPPFANMPYEPFSRSAAVAVAMDEWRLWGNRVDDTGGADYVQAEATMGERQQGLWQRIGEYWWEGMNAGDQTSGWTGKHDGAGHVFPVPENGHYAWSAAFISYVMRIAGAGRDFPYGADHATYINAAARHEAHGLLDAEDPANYAPRLGDLACFPRGSARNLTFADLPTTDSFPAHCGIVVGGGAESVTIIGGNVDDAVTMEHLQTNSTGELQGNRENWFVVLRVNYASP
ncbi:MAG: DUF2272 domain-containing protein [Acidocella sp.]|nr:DUF2272 domain-containing protein [Acidocella sp.]